jgi:hypothetical protein
MLPSTDEVKFHKATRITPIALFGCFEGPSGRISNMALKADRLSKADSLSVWQSSLEQLIKLADEFLTPDHPPGDRPIAFVGISGGPTLLNDQDGDWWKGDFDESKHPRWPAGTPGQGGQFSPKDGAPQASNSTNFPATVQLDNPEDHDPKKLPAPIEPENKPTKDLARRAARLAARRLLRTSFITALRTISGLAADLIPVAGEIYDAAEVAQTIEDYAELKTDVEAAKEFVDGGPRTIDELRVSQDDESFSSSRAFTKDLSVEEKLIKRYGPAGDGWEYHHLAGQGGDTSNVPSDKLHSTENIVKNPKLLHEEVSAVYSEKYENTNMTVREYVQKQPYEYQREYGIKVLRDLGIAK